MKEIKLNRGFVALVDDDDYGRLEGFNWRVQKGRNTFYAVATVKLHRLVLGIKDSKTQIDHENHDGLDCQKGNLRVASQEQNLAHARKHRNSKNKYKGVQFHKHAGKWMMRISRGKQTIVRYFPNEVRAAVEYDVLSRVLDREFACPNFELCPMTIQRESYSYTTFEPQ